MKHPQTERLYDKPRQYRQSIVAKAIRKPLCFSDYASDAAQQRNSGALTASILDGRNPWGTQREQSVFDPEVWEPLEMAHVRMPLQTGEKLRLR